MATQMGRVVCPKCGANNFDSVTECWKCNASLVANPSAGYIPQPAPRLPQMTMPGTGPSYAPGLSVESRHGQQPVMPSYAVQPRVDTGNPKVANRAAIILGLVMPFFGLPIGLAFMMCDDRRRQEVGRLCVFWSVISMIIHLLFMFAALLGARSMLGALLGGLKNARGGGGGGLEGF